MMLRRDGDRSGWFIYNRPQIFAQRKGFATSDRGDGCLLRRVTRSPKKKSNSDLIGIGSNPEESIRRRSIFSIFPSHCFVAKNIRIYKKDKIIKYNKRREIERHGRVGVNDVISNNFPQIRDSILGFDRLLIGAWRSIKISDN